MNRSPVRASRSGPKPSDDREVIGYLRGGAIRVWRSCQCALCRKFRGEPPPMLDRGTTFFQRPPNQEPTVSDTPRPLLNAGGGLLPLETP